MDFVCKSNEKKQFIYSVEKELTRHEMETAQRKKSENRGVGAIFKEEFSYFRGRALLERSTIYTQ